jgi:hypothetical protein
MRIDLAAIRTESDKIRQFGKDLGGAISSLKQANQLPSCGKRTWLLRDGGAADMESDCFGEGTAEFTQGVKFGRLSLARVRRRAVLITVIICEKSCALCERDSLSHINLGTWENLVAYTPAVRTALIYSYLSRTVASKLSIDASA